MNSGGDGPNYPLRSMVGVGVFAYGCPPIDTSPFVPPLSPDVTPLSPFFPTWPDFSELMRRAGSGLAPCLKCNKHVRSGEPCPFCLRDELDALKKALGPEAKPAETIETLRAALRKSLGALRDISCATGGSLEPLIADCEKALDA